MMRIKNWDKLQHFNPHHKGRSKPPWIKLYRDILDDHEWHALDGEAAKLLIMIWLMASETQGQLTNDKKKLAFRFRVSEAFINKHLPSLDHWVYQDDINVISSGDQDDILVASPGYQVDLQDKDKEKDKEKEKRGVETPPTPPPIVKKVNYAKNVKMLEKEHAALVEKHGKEAVEWMIQKLDDHIEAKGVSYKSHAAAIRSWVVDSYAEHLKRTSGGRESFSGTAPYPSLKKTKAFTTCSVCGWTGKSDVAGFCPDHQPGALGAVEAPRKIGTDEELKNVMEMIKNSLPPEPQETA